VDQLKYALQISLTYLLNNKSEIELGLLGYEDYPHAMNVYVKIGLNEKVYPYTAVIIKNINNKPILQDVQGLRFSFNLEEMEDESDSNMCLSVLLCVIIVLNFQ
jgi:hypothetical protein